MPRKTGVHFFASRSSLTESESRTEWGGIAHDSLVARSGATAYGPYASRHAKMFAGMEISRLPSPPEAVAKVIGDAVAAKRPRARYAAAGGAPIFLFLTHVLPDRMKDALMWRISQRN
ncbi:MAG: hypothetical protein WDN02_15565 [Methylovirgula sp.]|uniref:hypothetical protein n=1 Tax=Methylovirgula sp. TaxID=1978224 RepID=UPI003076420C